MTVGTAASKQKLHCAASAACMSPASAARLVSEALLLAGTHA